MNHSFTPLEKIPGQFDKLHKAIIDTSSIIYLDKIGAYERVSQLITLITIPEVIKECGSRIKHTRIEVVVFNVRATDGTDERLVAGATRLRLPVISDDKEILRVLQERHLPAYNTLMMINFLYYKKSIHPRTAKKLLNQLQKFGFYNEEIMDYGSSLFHYLKKV